MLVVVSLLFVCSLLLDRWYHVCATPPTVYTNIFLTLLVPFYDLKIRDFLYYPQINVCHVFQVSIFCNLFECLQAL